MTYYFIGFFSAQLWAVQIIGEFDYFMLPLYTRYVRVQKVTKRNTKIRSSGRSCRVSRAKTSVETRTN